MRFFRSLPIVAATAVALGLLAAGPASADTGTSAVIGPVPLPSVPAQVCVTQSAVAAPTGVLPTAPSAPGLIPGLLGALGLSAPSGPSGTAVTPQPGVGPVSRCVSTPGGGTISMGIDATALTPVAAVTPPSITRVPCPAGTSGVAGQVSSGSAAVAVAGAVTITPPGGAASTIPIAATAVPAGKTLTLYGCTGVS